MPRVPLLRSISSSRTVIHVFRYTTRVLNCRIVMADFRKTVSHAGQVSGCDLGCVASWRVAITADIAVIGLGAVGSAAIYQAAKLGARVVGMDRFQPPHDQGSSHGETRITRQAIGEGREFVPLVLRSNEIWEELEAATGRTSGGGFQLFPNFVRAQHKRHELATFANRLAGDARFAM